MGEAYGRRPSDIAGLPDEWAAFQFDSAALALGRKVETALSENASKKKAQRRKADDIVREILGDQPSGPDVHPTPLGRKAKTLRPGDPGWDEWKMFVE